MAELYRLLGLSRRADGSAIKRAYYRLAKRFHPDVNRSEETGERIREIIHAYETLSDPVARADYDTLERDRRLRSRRRMREALAAGAATFVLTLSATPLFLPVTKDESARDAASFVVTEAMHVERLATAIVPQCLRMDAGDPLFLPDGDADAPRDHCAGVASKRTIPFAEILADLEDEAIAYARPLPQLDPSLVVLSAGGTLALELRPKPVHWMPIDYAAAGFELKYPADVFSARASGADADDRLFVSQDQRALLRVYAGRTRAPTLPAKYRAALLAGRYAGASLDYAPQREQWFVLSGTLGAEMFYERVSFSCDRRAFHAWLLTYPVAERAFYDAIVEEMHRSYRTGKSEGWRCGAAQVGGPKGELEAIFASPY